MLQRPLTADQLIYYLVESPVHHQTSKVQWVGPDYLGAVLRASQAGKRNWAWESGPSHPIQRWPRVLRIPAQCAFNQFSWILGCWYFYRGFPGDTVVKNLPAMQKTCRRHSFDPWVREIPWRRNWQPTPVFVPGRVHGLQSVRHDWAHTHRFIVLIFSSFSTVLFSASLHTFSALHWINNPPQTRSVNMGTGAYSKNLEKDTEYLGFPGGSVGKE